MFKILQTVHHNDGKDPHRTWYTSSKDFDEALDLMTQYNVRTQKTNHDKTKIAITYHIEYEPSNL